jgi:uncharacterized membrane protein YgcG
VYGVGIFVFALMTVYAVFIADAPYWELLITFPFIFLAFIAMAVQGDEKLPLGCSISVIIVPLLMLSFIIVDGTESFSWISILFYTIASLLFTGYAHTFYANDNGAPIIAEAAGLKMYMKTAEEHRLRMLTPPERTPELFEKLLPYAIALDVSNEWCKKFNHILSRFNYRPDWYQGAEAFSSAGFSRSFTKSFNTSVSRVANTSNSSSRSSGSSGSRSWSSGSSGGGSSGGGGGGGGRGW